MDSRARVRAREKWKAIRREWQMAFRHWEASALCALEAAGPTAAAALEGALAGAALRTVRRMASGTLGMPLAVVARPCAIATRAIVALAIGGTRPIVAALLPMNGPLVVAAPVGAIGTGWLDRDARS